MAERLRALLEDPLDPRVARAVLVLGFAALAVLAGTAGLHVDSPTGGSWHRGTGPKAAWPARRQAADQRSEHSARHVAQPSQDPQDHPGTVAAARAEDELASHRALQHVPYRGDGFTVLLVGVKEGRAILRVGARTVAAAQRDWHRFLRRYRDSGSAYSPLFEAEGGPRG